MTHAISIDRDCPKCKEPHRFDYGGLDGTTGRLLYMGQVCRHPISVARERPPEPEREKPAADERSPAEPVSGVDKLPDLPGWTRSRSPRTDALQHAERQREQSAVAEPRRCVLCDRELTKETTRWLKTTLTRWMGGSGDPVCADHVACNARSGIAEAPCKNCSRPRDNHTANDRGGAPWCSAYGGDNRRYEPADIAASKPVHDDGGPTPERLRELDAPAPKPAGGLIVVVPPDGVRVLNVTSKMDGTEALCLAVYGRKETPSDYLGGSQARMLHDAAALIASLRAEVTRLNNVVATDTAEAERLQRLVDARADDEAAAASKPASDAPAHPCWWLSDDQVALQDICSRAGLGWRGSQAWIMRELLALLDRVRADKRKRLFAKAREHDAGYPEPSSDVARELWDDIEDKPHKALRFIDEVLSDERKRMEGRIDSIKRAGEDMQRKLAASDENWFQVAAALLETYCGGPGNLPACVQSVVDQRDQLRAERDALEAKVREVERRAAETVGIQDAHTILELRRSEQRLRDQLELAKLERDEARDAALTPPRSEAIARALAKGYSIYAEVLPDRFAWKWHHQYCSFSKGEFGSAEAAALNALQLEEDMDRKEAQAREAARQSEIAELRSRLAELDPSFAAALQPDTARDGEVICQDR